MRYLFGSIFKLKLLKTINKYLTRNPKLNLAIDLQKIIRNLTTTTENKFTKKLDEWYEKHKDTLLE